ncbi:MAG TPA: hypothetical protein VGS07_17515 [Thermoanaerobaculia bacterium]|jgi:hypothetical protein|nr:hypothetical protein [Thermoanaerobaculia bacterium]
MLAEVLQQFSSTFTDLATKELKLTYTAGNPPGSQFTFDTPTGQPYLFIDEETPIVVKLQNATFVPGDDKQITWISPTAPVFPSHLDSENQLHIHITDAPSHYFTPWILSFNVNVEGANGVTSPTFSLVLPPDGEASIKVNLQYAINTGVFTLASAGSLANLSILTNNITPFDVTFHLVADPTVTFDPTTPLLGPSWLSYALNIATQELTVSIPENPDKFASLRFVLDVGSVRVTSPDPIIVNATIGDG